MYTEKEIQRSSMKNLGLAKSRIEPRPQVFCDANAHRVARRGKNTWGLADNVPALMKNLQPLWQLDSKMRL